VFQDVEQITALDVKNDVLEPDAAIRRELRVLRVRAGRSTSALGEWSHDVCLGGTHWHRLECAHECAQTRSEVGRPPANANHETKKNGPEIVDFRPVP
jgi:hypothetical protein